LHPPREQFDGVGDAPLLSLCQEGGAIKGDAPEHYPHIDALRGYAVIAVVATHVQELTPDLPFVVKRCADFAASGVLLFFVVSAFTLTASWRRRDDGPMAFYIRRLFRIAPAFWLAAIFYLAFPWWARSYWAPNGVTGPTVALTFLFLNGWSPEMFNTVVPGGWSIATEVGFYAFFPVPVMVLRSVGAALAACVMAAVLAITTTPAVFAVLREIYPLTPTDLVARFQTMWFPGTLYTFLAGIAAWQGTAIGKVSGRQAELEVAAALLLIFALPFSQPPQALANIGPSVAFALLTHGLASGGGRYLVNRFVARIGVVSFSIYLWHFEIVMLLRGLVTPQHGWHGADFAGWCIVVLAVSYLVAEVSYRLVERPFINLGAGLARRIATITS
jgi:peptidoglycan/LPS O-acetylase OafA/YrhL